MQRDSDRQGDEDAWRAIVENYGDRVPLDEDDASFAAPPTGPTATPPATPPTLPTTYAVSWPGDRLEQESSLAGPDADAGVAEEEERFVPPEPPPLPEIPHDRKVAWLGLFGAPAVLLICLVVGIRLPPLLGYLLVGAFIGGFVYLVATMPRGPVDPFDDGARL